jgi:hypothetical protein
VHDETDGVDYCVQFRCDRDGGGIPIEDLMLAQKLLLESDESQFMRIANKRKVMWEPAGGGWLSEAMLHDERRLRGT